MEKSNVYCIFIDRDSMKIFEYFVFNDLLWTFSKILKNVKNYTIKAT